MAIKLASPAVLQYTEFRNNTGVPVVHVFAAGENGELYVLSADAQPGQHPIQGTWASLGLTPTGARVSSLQPVGTVTYIDTSGARQAHAFVVGQDNRLYALSLNLDNWEWRALPPLPGTVATNIASSPAVLAYLFEARTFNIVAFVIREKGGGTGSDLLAYLFDGAEEDWVTFPPSPNLFIGPTVGATVFFATSSQQSELYAVTPLGTTGQAFLMTWDGGRSSISSKQWSTLNEGQVPSHLTGDSVLTTVSVPIMSLQRSASFNTDGSGNLFASISEDGTHWNWNNLGTDQSGRVAEFGGLGAFSYVRVVTSRTSRFFVPLHVAAVRFNDGSLALNVTDNIDKSIVRHSTWTNLGKPLNGAIGRPCGAGFYVGSAGHEVETAIVLTANTDGHIFINEPGPFGREWFDLGLAAG